MRVRTQEEILFHIYQEDRLVFACEIPARWEPYPAGAHSGYRVAPASGAGLPEDKYYVDAPDLFPYIGPRCVGLTFGCGTVTGTAIAPRRSHRRTLPAGRNSAAPVAAG